MERYSGLNTALHILKYKTDLDRCIDLEVWYHMTGHIVHQKHKMAKDFVTEKLWGY